ncbi:MAG: BLUF domain-containing protein [Pseudomonadota bacterium]
MFKQVIYRSEAIFPKGDLSNLDILREALKRNAALGLTGYLIRHNKTFLQAIEGPRKTVEITLDRIARDRRHHSMVMLGQAEDGDRHFSEWTMGYTEVPFGAGQAIDTMTALEALALLRRVADREMARRCLDMTA